MRRAEPSTGRSRGPWTGLSARHLMLAIALTSQGCAQPMTPSEARSPIPANLTAPCADLTPLEEGTGAAVLRKIVEVAEMYYDCRRKHEALVEAVK